MSPLPIVLAIGDHRRQEFISVMGWLQERARVVCLRAAHQLADRSFKISAPPLLIVWLQSFASEFFEADRKAVAHTFPGVNMVCVHAAFAEGETRTGKPLAGVQRWPFHGWRGRLEPLWRIACHESRRDDAAATRVASRNSIHVGVYSGSRGMNSVLCEAVRCLGFETSALATSFGSPHPRSSVHEGDPQTSDFQVAIWEDSRDPRSELTGIVEFVEAVDPRPVIAITGFPRWQDADRVAASGVRHILGKPFQLPELAFHLDHWAIPNDCGK